MNSPVKWTLFLDRYDLRARTLPSLLALLPALFAFVTVYPVAESWQQAGFSILISCGMLFLLAQIARDAGKRVQERLFSRWSGAPTTLLLRHRDRRIDVHTKRALHSKLGLLTGIRMPLAAEEAEDPVGADETYRAASAWLIRRTRDTSEFALLFKENINFGFQRNALGLKWVGIFIATLSALWVLASFGVLTAFPVRHSVEALRELPATAITSLIVSGLMFLVWVFAITSEAVRRTGFSYAERLLEATDRLKD